MTTTTQAITTTDATSSLSPQDTEDYTKLVNEIKSTIDRSDALFKTIQESNYPNAGQYRSDLANYKINSQITDLTKTRNEIWTYLTKKYNENTELRKFYFNEIRKADEYISVLTKQYDDAQNEIKDKLTASSTAYEKLKQQKYYYNRNVFYSYVYKLLLFVQFIILMLASLAILDMIPFSTFLVVTVIILIATLGYVGYYIFFVNVRRNKHDWNKFEFDSNEKSSGSSKNNLLFNELDDQEKKKVDLSLKDILDKSKKDSCIV